MDGVEVLDSLPNNSMFPCLPAWVRYILFVVTLFTGFTLTSMALGEESVSLFYFLWIFGVICAWFSTVFIMSLQKQIKHMTKSLDNKICNIVILISFIITIIIYAFNSNMWAYIWFYLTLFVALIWYDVSLIPGAQTCLRGCCSSLFNCLP